MANGTGMNQELKLLLDMMNVEGQGAQALTMGNQQNKVEPLDDQPSLTGEFMAQREGTNPQVTQTGERELTEEELQNNPVINNARRGGQNRISGVSDFLANPEVQNALINFGQAFANQGNFTGQDNPINQIGEAGRGVIQRNANQRAMEAFERGQDPAQAAGQFADPELVTQLQQQQQQQEQFNREMEAQERSLDIKETQLKQDWALNAAKLIGNQEIAQQELQLKKQENEINESLQEQREKLLEAQTKLMEARAGAEGQQDIEDLAQVTSEYLDLLDQQQENLRARLENVEAIDEEMNDLLTGGGALRSTFGVNLNTNEAAVKRQARELGIPVKTDDQGNLDMQAIQEQVDNQKDQIQQQINQAETQKQTLRVAQSQRLSGGGVPTGGGGGDTSAVGSSKENPAYDGPSADEALNRASPGDIVKVMGTWQKVTADGRLDALSDQSDPEEETEEEEENE